MKKRKNYKDMLCKICLKSYKIVGLGVHIKLIHELSAQEYYDINHVKIKGGGLCLNNECDNETSFRGLRLGYLKCCSISCATIYSYDSNPKRKKNFGKLMKKILTGKKKSKSHIANMSKNNARYWLGKKQSAELIEKRILRGKDHYRWNVDKVRDYGIEFTYKLKEEIRIRDNRKCRKCRITEGDSGYKLDVHHIDRDKKNNKKSNLISLCHSCHSKSHATVKIKTSDISWGKAK